MYVASFKLGQAVCQLSVFMLLETQSFTFIYDVKTSHEQTCNHIKSAEFGPN